MYKTKFDCVDSKRNVYMYIKFIYFCSGYIFVSMAQITRSPRHNHSDTQFFSVHSAHHILNKSA